MKHKLRNLAVAAFVSITLSACSSCLSKPKALSALPAFDGNVAYDQILTYEKFGPKIPGNVAHVKTGDWIVSELKKTGFKILEQKGTAKTYEGKEIPIRNIIAQFNPDADDRYLLSAHWDTRPFADEDPDPKYKKTPVPGINDGGSGVVVLLGIAKAMSGKDYPFGVDLAFLDAEDLGVAASEESYCLGTQYWAKNPVPANYKAKFGINYDMVGRIGATFPVEGFSAEKAGTVISKLQTAAKELGYQDFFPNTRTGYITDDHLFLMKGLGFPVADLIHMTPSGHFPPEWHTHSDTSEFISRDVLKVVGQTTLKVLWNEAKPTE